MSTPERTGLADRFSISQARWQPVALVTEVSDRVLVCAALHPQPPSDEGYYCQMIGQPEIHIECENPGPSDRHLRC